MREMQELAAWLGAAKRRAGQVTGRNESDCEIVRIPGRGYLAATVDTVAEEIEHGLYEDPYTMGWMTATASLSDLAAIGARPLGFLFAATWARDWGVTEKRRVAAGLKAALRIARCPLLGGDSGEGRVSALTGVGLGFTARKPFGRIGIRPGDRIYLGGPLGRGPAFGFRRLLGDPAGLLPERAYRPRARLALGRRLLAFGARAAMDTSDGLAATLATLGELNGVGFELEWSESWLDPLASRFCRAAGIPLPALLFGEHGDFDLVFALRPGARAPKGAIPLGRAVKGRSSVRSARAAANAIDLGRFANAEKRGMAGIEAAFREMLAYAGGLI